jgi:hypothetical protein
MIWQIKFTSFCKHTSSFIILKTTESGINSQRKLTNFKFANTEVKGIYAVMIKIVDFTPIAMETKSL